MNTIERLIQQKITLRLQPNKVILLFGARRVGKTVLIREIVKQFGGKYLLLNGEDVNTLLLLEKQTVSNFKHLLMS